MSSGVEREVPSPCRMCSFMCLMQVWTGWEIPGATTYLVGAALACSLPDAGNRLENDNLAVGLIDFFSISLG